MTGLDNYINAINSIELFSTTMTTAAVSVPAVIVPMTTILTGSRPKGTTQMASASMQRRKIEECIVQSATEYMRVREELQQKNKKASRFTIACIIGVRKEALGIPPGVEINIETVRSWKKRKKTGKKRSFNVTNARS